MYLFLHYIIDVHEYVDKRVFGCFSNAHMYFSGLVNHHAKIILTQLYILYHNDPFIMFYDVHVHISITKKEISH